MGKKINGVKGFLDTNSLGFTLMHEHFCSVDWAMRIAFPGEWIDRNRLVERIVENVNNAMSVGVKTFVDQSAINMGRDIGIIQEVVEKTGIQAIVSTGLYWNEEPYLPGKDPYYLASLFVSEIEQGVQGTDTKAGMIKCGTDKYGFSDANLTVLNAVGIAAAKTKVPIATHTIANAKHGFRQQEIFAENGVDLNRVIIGHLGDTDDLDYLIEIMKRGSYIGLDRFGSEFIFPETNRINNIIELISRGYIEQLIVSHDQNTFYDWGDHYWYKQKDYTLDDLEVYTFFSKTIIPVLMERGVSQKEIDQLTKENPKKIFET